MGHISIILYEGINALRRQFGVISLLLDLVVLQILDWDLIGSCQRLVSLPWMKYIVLD
jgi:hypothetical protein